MPDMWLSIHKTCRSFAAVLVGLGTVVAAAPAPAHAGVTWTLTDGFEAPPAGWVSGGRAGFGTIASGFGARTGTAAGWTILRFPSSPYESLGRRVTIGVAAGPGPVMCAAEVYLSAGMSTGAARFNIDIIDPANGEDIAKTQVLVPKATGRAQWVRSWVKWNLTKQDVFVQISQLWTQNLVVEQGLMDDLKITCSAK